MGEPRRCQRIYQSERRRAAVTGARIDLDYSREVFDHIPLPKQALGFPELRYMGSKHRLLPWIHGVLHRLDFQTAADPFTGSGSVAYLLKAMGKAVIASDFLNFPAVLASATVANNKDRIDADALRQLLVKRRNGPHFIEKTFAGVFYEKSDLQFLDRVSANIGVLANPFHRSLAKSALIRSCLKKQPRGVFTISGDLSRYDDGRRDRKAAYALRVALDGDRGIRPIVSAVSPQQDRSVVQFQRLSGSRSARRSFAALQGSRDRV